MGPLDQDRLEIIGARARWAKYEPVWYEFQLYRECYCGNPVPVIITVTDGVVTSVRPNNSMTPLPAEEFANYPTVDGLFAMALRGGLYRVEGEFNPETGFPQYFSVDGSAQVIDDEVVYHLSLLLGAFDR